MDYLDDNKHYSQSQVIKSIQEIDEKIQDGIDNESLSPEDLTRLRYEQLLRGMYLQGNPLIGM